MITEPLTRLTEWHGWIIMGRLTYGSYLLHMNLMHAVSGSKAQLIHVVYSDVVSFFNVKQEQTSLLMVSDSHKHVRNNRSVIGASVAFLFARSFVKVSWRKLYTYSGRQRAFLPISCSLERFCCTA